MKGIINVGPVSPLKCIWVCLWEEAIELSSGYQTD